MLFFFFFENETDNNQTITGLLLSIKTQEQKKNWFLIENKTLNDAARLLFFL